MNILEEADKIVNHRSLEKERQYGPFHDAMEKTSRIASEIADRYISPEEAYAVLIALKLARHSHSYKEDNLLDAVAYIGSLNDYIQKYTDK